MRGRVERELLRERLGESGVFSSAVELNATIGDKHGYTLDAPFHRPTEKRRSDPAIVRPSRHSRTFAALALLVHLFTGQSHRIVERASKGCHDQHAPSFNRLMSLEDSTASFRTAFGPIFTQGMSSLVLTYRG